MAVTLMACRKDNPEEPAPPIATFEGFEIDDEGWIVSPEWLASNVKSDDYVSFSSVYMFKYNGEDCICLDGNHSSYLLATQGFFSLSGELLLEPSYPGTKEEYELFFAMSNAMKETGVIIWKIPRASSSITTRADEEIEVYTPHNKPLGNAYILDELTDVQIEERNEEMRLVYTNAEILPHPYSPTLPGAPTKRYNCHAYAWHMSEGGSPVWIDAPIDIYWEDGSYVEIPSSVPGAKVVYTGFESWWRQRIVIHSAIAETGNTVVSKWDRGPLVRHLKDYHPYDYTESIGEEIGYKYYKRNTPLVITGPNLPLLGTNMTYSVPTAQDITFDRWEITPSSGYTITGGTTGRTMTIRFTTYGTYLLKANFTLPNGSTYTATKTVSFSPPKPATPAIYGSGAQEVYLPGYDAPVFWARPGTRVEFRVDNYHQYSSQALVARTATLDLGSEWSYYIRDVNGDYHWQTAYPTETEVNRSYIQTQACSMPWVFKKDGTYYMVFEAYPFGRAIYISRSDKPYGPFTDQKLLFTLPKTLDKIGEPYPNHWYMVNLHDSLSREGELVFSTNSDPVNFWDNFNSVGSADFYRPFFFRVYNWESLYAEEQEE